MEWAVTVRGDARGDARLPLAAREETKNMCELEVKFEFQIRTQFTARLSGKPKFGCLPQPSNSHVPATTFTAPCGRATRADGGSAGSARATNGSVSGKGTTTTPTGDDRVCDRLRRRRRRGLGSARRAPAPSPGEIEAVRRESTPRRRAHLRLVLRAEPTLLRRRHSECRPLGAALARVRLHVDGARLFSRAEIDRTRARGPREETRGAERRVRSDGARANLLSSEGERRRQRARRATSARAS